ncbi:prepilin peptidase [Bittarella massiliensis]|uniref:prepilin peptidase n=1 Tax=Bittarella massiliensis (ex Durand et al. 2017) TaxID=1720313 RepID=UPI00163C7AD7|nr:prepilin peptidase [Bittarella massiliensis (ex Durand et al. 2017)]
MPASYYVACTVLALLLFAFGSVIGSFLNVVIYRAPQGISVAKGRSFCPSCGKTLRPLDMVPVFSWLALRGRCRSCGAPISPRYPLVECAGGVLALLCVGALGPTPLAAVAFGALCALLCVACIDAATMEIPNGLVLVLAAFALLAVPAAPEVGLLSRLLGAAEISLPLFLCTRLVPESFGGGDVKLMAVAGFLLGWRATLAAAFLALVGGGLYGVWLLATRRAGRKSHFAFGPFLAGGIGVALLWGEGLIAGYLSLFGLA